MQTSGHSWAPHKHRALEKFRAPGKLWALHKPHDTALPLASTVRQIDGLQILRAFAVALVVLCHSGQILNETGSHTLPNLGVFGIDLFFVLSGFILSLTVLKDRSQPGLKPMLEFMKRRLIRIYPIYWFFALITLFRFTLAGQLFAHDYVPAFFLFPGWHYPGQSFILAFSWTMMFEVFFYIVLGVILLVTTRRAVHSLILLLSSVTLIGAIVGIRHPYSIWFANPILLEFVFGAVLALLYSRIGPRRTPGILLTVIGVATTIALRSRNLPSIANGAQMILVDHGAFARVFTWGLCAAVIVAGVVFWSPSTKSVLAKWTVLLGNSSYSAYLASALVLEFASRLLFHIKDTTSYSLGHRLLYQSTMVAATFAVGLITYIVIEKPMLRSLQNKLLHKTPAKSSSTIETARPISVLVRPA